MKFCNGDKNSTKVHLVNIFRKMPFNFNEAEISFFLNYYFIYKVKKTLASLVLPIKFEKRNRNSNF